MTTELEGSWANFLSKQRKFAYDQTLSTNARLVWNFLCQGIDSKEVLQKQFHTNRSLLIRGDHYARTLGLTSNEFIEAEEELITKGYYT